VGSLLALWVGCGDAEPDVGSTGFPDVPDSPGDDPTTPDDTPPGDSPEPPPPPSPSPPTDDPLPTFDVVAGDWRPAPLPAGRIDAAAIRPLGGGLEGPALWVDNNPEKVFGNGWTMQSGRADAQRGGRSDGLGPRFVAYAFHVNGSSATRYYHVLVTNPNPETATVTAVGAAYNNAQRPLNGPGTGQSYAVADAFRTGAFNVDVDAIVPTGTGRELARVRMPPSAMVDVRLVVETDRPVFVYGVVTSSGSTNDAINLSQAGSAAGEIVSPGPNAFGRQAGIFDQSRWAGTTRIELATGYVGLAFNTNDKFALDGVRLQDQSAIARTSLADSSVKSYGNYGMDYDVELDLFNPTTSALRVDLTFASNVVGDSDRPSFTWSGPVVVDGVNNVVFTTPRAPRQPVASVVVEPGQHRRIPVAAYVPGLITAGAHLLLEAQPQ